jgi:hypothetical protein
MEFDMNMTAISIREINLNAPPANVDQDRGRIRMATMERILHIMAQLRIMYIARRDLREKKMRDIRLVKAIEEAEEELGRVEAGLESL